MMAQKTVYMDYNATTPLRPEVKQAIIDALDIYGNPSSIHNPGREGMQLVNHAREQIAALINASPEEIVFTAGGSESNNAVLKMVSCGGVSCCKFADPHREIITTAIEHPSVLETVRFLEARGTKVHILDVDSTGLINLEQLKEHLTSKTVLVSIMMANNEIGTIQNIKEISRITHEAGALLHTDAVQAIGKIPVDAAALGIDYLSCSSHKIHGPKGVGALYIRKELPFCPFLHGGHQEGGRRAGTINSSGIAGFGTAAEYTRKNMEEEMQAVRALRDRLKKGIEERIPNIALNGHPEACLPNTLNVSFPGAEGEAILLYLDLEGIAVSTGSACASGSLDPSHVLLATGLGPELAHGSVRFSLGRENTIEDVDYVLETLPRVIKKIRDMSTLRTGASA